MTAALAAGELGPLKITEVSSHTCTLAITLLKRHPLRAGDALHLAAALSAFADVFVCSNLRLLAAAEQEGLVCLNPVAHADEE